MDYAYFVSKIFKYIINIDFKFFIERQIIQEINKHTEKHT